jgi:hypothetical protein
MNDLLFHPKLVHLPMALGLLMPLVAGGLWIAWWREWLPRRGWVVAIVLQALLLGSGILALRSGEVEEDRVEQVVPEAAIEAHEEAAKVFVAASAAVLLVIRIAGAPRGRRTGLALAGAATLGTLLVLGLGYRTGQAGGALVYEHGAAQAYARPGGEGGMKSPAEQHARERDRDDDDDDDD